MRNFLYLRMVAIIILVYVTSTFVHSLYIQFKNFDTLYWWFLPIRLMFFMFPGANSLSVLQLHMRYYPDQEVPAGAILFYRVTRVLAIIGIILLCASVAANYYLITKLEFRTSLYRTIAVTLVFVTLLIIQLVGGARMLRVIRANARKQLEESFA